MRIMLVSDSFAPRLDGVAIAVWREARRYAAAGNDVLVLAVSTDAQAARTQCAGVCDAVLVKPWFSASSGYPTRLFNGKVVRETVERFKPDMIRIHTIGPLGSEGLLAGRSRGIRMEMFWHTDLAYYGDSYPVTATYLTSRLARVKPSLYRHLLRGPQAFFRGTLAYLLGYVSHIDVPSKKSEKQAREFGFTGTIDVRPTPAAIVDSPLPHEASGKQILYVGRIAREKNIPLLLDAFALASATDPDLRLTIAGPEGDKRTRKALETWLATQGDRAQWVGGVPREKVAELMSQADVVAIPSLSETQCLVIGEARSVGPRVVMVDADLHLSYADDDGVTCVEPTPQALAAELVRVLA